MKQSKEKAQKVPDLATVLTSIQVKFSKQPVQMTREQAQAAADLLHVLGKAVAAEKRLALGQKRDMVSRSLHMLASALTAPACDLQHSAAEVVQAPTMSSDPAGQPARDRDRPSGFKQPPPAPGQLASKPLHTRPACQPSTPQQLTALHHLPPKGLSKAAWPLQRLKQLDAAGVVNRLAAAMASAAATSTAMEAAEWFSWPRVAYGLSKAGLKCSNEPECLFTRVFQRACQKLEGLGVKGAGGQDVSNLLLAADEAGADPQIIRPLVSALSKELSAGNNFRMSWGSSCFVSQIRSPIVKLIVAGQQTQLISSQGPRPGTLTLDIAQFRMWARMRITCLLGVNMISGLGTFGTIICIRKVY